MIEAVLVSNRESKKPHRELYHSPEEAYRIVDEDILVSVVALPPDLVRLHIVATWRDLLRVAAWKTDPGIGDALVLLKQLGVSSEDLLPFVHADIGDLLPWLYYGKHVPVLRKLCQVAKANAERHLKNRDGRAYCHLVSEDCCRIVASSL